MTFPKLTTRFLLLTLGLFIVMAAVSIGSFLYELNTIVGRLGRSYAIERAQAATSQVADLLEREAALAKKLADSPVIERWMRDEHDSARRTAAFEELNSYRRAFLDTNYFVTVDSSKDYYNHPTDAALAMTTLSKSNPADAWYFNEIAAGTPTTFNLDYNRLIGAAKVWINCIVRAGGEVLGMAGTGIDITDLVAHLVSAEGKNASSMLIDGEGVITVHPNVGYLEHNAYAGAAGKKITVYDLASSPSDRKKMETLVADARAGRTEVAYVRLQNHGSLTAVAPIPEIGWMMVVSVDTASLINLGDFVPLFAVLIISILLALLLIALLMDRMVLKPLAGVTRSANLIAAGDYALTLPTVRHDEIGALSSAFNEMTSRVREYTRNLEGLVKERTSQLVAANDELALANRTVMDSIRYARQIQDGLMAPESALASHFPSFSFFHRQRDTVGGDFLFLRDFEDSEGFMIAVMDCEGHGVSGALMTMMADSFLRLIAGGRDHGDPAKCLMALEAEMRSSLRQESGQSAVQGGLDIGICVCSPASRTILFAGAGMPLYVRDADGTVRTVTGRRKPIGYRKRTRSSTFENHRLETEGRAFFLVTDGYVDQSGGAEGRAYGTKRLFEHIASCRRQNESALPMWESEFDSYRGARGQRDDVLALGFTL
ncbi:MAG TPA: SpoIIE family protein phosphatase [Spirochaetia bacterium]|nr:SpoIIE family protein phosphatase [Spirochaetia bacterium]